MNMEIIRFACEMVHRSLRKLLAREILSLEQGVQFMKPTLFCREILCVFQNATQLLASIKVSFNVVPCKPCLVSKKYTLFESPALSKFEKVFLHGRIIQYILEMRYGSLD